MYQIGTLKNVIQLQFYRLKQHSSHKLHSLLVLLNRVINKQDQFPRATSRLLRQLATCTPHKCERPMGPLH